MPENPRLQPRSTLAGLRVQAGPLMHAGMTFGPGVTALIGLNGAGKTWVLRALRAALQGRSLGLSFLHCDLPPGSAGYTWVQQQLVPARDRYSVWSPEKLHSYTPEQADEDRARLAEAAGKWFVDGGEGHKPDLYEAKESGLIGSIAEELSRSTTFCLIPTGSEAAEWQLWLCAPADRSPYPNVEAARRQFLSRESDLVEMRQSHDSAFALIDDDLAAGRIDETEHDRRTDEILEEWASFGFDLYEQPAAGLLWQFRNDYAPDEALELMLPHLRHPSPLPMVLLGKVSDIPFVLFDDRDSSDLDLATATAFLHSGRGPAAGFDYDPELVVEMEAWTSAVARTANEVFGSLLQDAPRLELNVRPVEEWLVAPALHWSAPAGSAPSRDVAVIEMSQAEQRWARFAIRWALDSLVEERTPVVVIDEPEAALHRSAEEHIAGGLDALTIDGTQVILATHSPLITDEPTTTLYEVVKLGGRSELRVLDFLGREALGRLGLRPSDLLRRYRVFVLVEGEHDEIVLRTLCKNQLREGRAEIIALRGGSKLPRTTDSQMLFDFTDAHLVAVLDNVDAQYVARVWTDAKDREGSSGIQAAIDHVAQAFKHAPRKADEYQWIASWLQRALKKGESTRLDPHGLRARDIIEYLPVEVLVPGGSQDWDALRAEHARELPNLNKAKGLHDFKTWLSQRKGADTSVHNIQRAADAVIEVPEEILQLGYRIREIGLRPRQGK